MSEHDQIKLNLDEIRKRAIAAADRAGRDPKEITLIAVSKLNPADSVCIAAENEQYEFGENWVKELLDKQIEVNDYFSTKSPQTAAKIKWHFIGHLQTNKVKQLIGKTELIHSVDSLKLAKVIDSESKKKDLITDILLEINIAGEESKYGIRPEEAVAFTDSLAELSNIKIRGLMTVAPICDDPDTNRPYFRKMRDLFVDIKSKNYDNIDMSVLSMGMTLDFETAIEEGATHIRVGTGIFGARDYGAKSESR
ncbi:MAG: YggS family pyridoxal phosphate-dependent enzyme [Lachnospiraceae bacterium]|nr:YggS family pyridoxal phosphate-dependent enzyme [Lachnospiraceae bacterium]